MTSVQARPAAYTPGQMLTSVRDLRPLIEANRRWSSEDARMAPDVLEACREAGVFTMVSPRELGGADVRYPELLAAFEELGYSDPAVAWHTGNSFAIGQNVAYMEQAVGELLFSGAPGPFGFSGIIAGKGAPVEGGYLLSGRWQFLTGCLDAPWAWLHGTVDRDGESSDLRAFIVPAEALSIERTWDSAVGMRGTGSHAVSCADLFVPEALAYSLTAPPNRRLESNSSRWPRFASSPISNAATALGIARRMVAEAIELVTAQKPRQDYAAYRDRPDIQRSIAHANSTVAAANAAMQAMAEEIQDIADRGERCPVQVRARMWATFWWTMDTARQVANEMTLIGTSKLYSQWNLMDVCLRDLNAIAAASEAEREFEEAAGRVLLGMPPAKTAF